jgi:hypothetical protein
MLKHPLANFICDAANKTEESAMSIKTVGCLVLISLVAGMVTAKAEETGTKTMPSSSIYPPPTRLTVFGTRQHYDCYLPSELCDNRHRVSN